MPAYVVTFIDGNSTEIFGANRYEMKGGFFSFFHDDWLGCDAVFRSYSAKDVRHVVLQKDYAINEMVGQIEAVESLNYIRDVLLLAERTGAERDYQEGSRLIHISDTLANEMIEKLNWLIAKANHTP